MAYIFLIVAFSLNALANILLKQGALRGLDLAHGLLPAILGNWQLIAGAAIFALNILFYFLALRTLPLSFAYPVMVAMGFLIVNGYAIFGLGETIVLREIVGFVLIVIGLMLVVLRSA
jgi:multidrug transporter EmrE-like cation transporter